MVIVLLENSVPVRDRLTRMLQDISVVTAVHAASASVENLALVPHVRPELLLLGTGLGLIPSTLATFRALPNAPEIALIVPEEEPASQAQYRRLGIHRVVPISGDLARLAALVRDLAARSRAK